MMIRRFFSDLLLIPSIWRRLVADIRRDKPDRMLVFGLTRSQIANLTNILAALNRLVASAHDNPDSTLAFGLTRLQITDLAKLLMDLKRRAWE